MAKRGSWLLVGLLLCASGPTQAQLKGKLTNALSKKQTRRSYSNPMNELGQTMGGDMWSGPQKNPSYFALIIKIVRSDPARARLASKLSNAELEAIIGYRTLDYVPVNETLFGKRGAKAKRDLAPHVKLLKGALRKLPDYVGEVHRMAHVPATRLPEYKVGATVTEPAFVSAATPEIDRGRSDVGRWAGTSNVRFTIVSKHGKLISPIAGNDREGEVLFTAGTKFHVERVEDISPPDRPGTRAQIYMREV